jgi:hypothetical protein
MRASHFKEANRVFALPDRKLNEKRGDLTAQYDEVGNQVVSLWVMSWRERIAALVYGRVWLGVAGEIPPPVWLSCEKDVHQPIGTPRSPHP